MEKKCLTKEEAYKVYFRATRLAPNPTEIMMKKAHKVNR